MTNPINVHLEAQGSKPNFRYDIIQPLAGGRVPIDGVTLTTAGGDETAGIFENDRFKNGEFGLLDTNFGDIIPAIDAGWDFVVLPVIIKRKPVYNYVWVRADRGIDSPKDLEGKTIATSSWGVVTTYTRGMLQRFHDVDLSGVHWIVNNTGPWQLHKPVDVEYPDEKRPQWDRLLDGEADACTGDITASSAWERLESSPDKVKRLFPDYREMHRQLWKDHRIVTPSHVIVMGGKLHRENPGLARKLYEAFERSREIAIDDALGDGTSYNLIMDARENVRDQLKEMGDIAKHGIAANREVIDMTLDFYGELGQTSHRLSIEEVFASGTLDT
jgi:4,5-dihydroxyphthalate decarboxylase